MTTNLKPYEIQINEIALFAKRINYNIDNGIENLMKLWIKEGLKFQHFVQDNKEDFIKNIKNYENTI